MIKTLSTNNIIANSNHSIIVTIVNSWLTFDLVINFQFASAKKCFVCDKFNCWSTNHTKKKRDDFKKRFANRNLKWKSRQRFERRLKQFIIEFEDNQDENFIIQFFEELNIDFEISFDNMSRSSERTEMIYRSIVVWMIKKSKWAIFICLIYLV
jgi:hypothetical protein